jgi:hypothetical protein
MTGRGESKEMPTIKLVPVPPSRKGYFLPSSLASLYFEMKAWIEGRPPLSRLRKIWSPETFAKEKDGRRITANNGLTWRSHPLKILSVFLSVPIAKELAGPQIFPPEFPQAQPRVVDFFQREYFGKIQGALRFAMGKSRTDCGLTRLPGKRSGPQGKQTKSKARAASGCRGPSKIRTQRYSR